MQLTRSGLLPANIRWRVAEGADSPETTDGLPREIYIWGVKHGGGRAEATCNPAMNWTSVLH
jgi:hypothetical protein